MLSFARNILLSCFVIVALIACKDEVHHVVKKATDPETTPTIITHKVRTLISDSGYTKLRITTDTWNVYSEAVVPKWTFPKGAFLEELDHSFKVIATVRCDSASYRVNEQLWELNGNVTIKRTKPQKLLVQTNQMFWDQRRDKVYSDSFIHVEEITRQLEGYGFTSNQRLTTYRVNNVMGIFPVDENRRVGGGRRTEAADSTAND